MGNCLKCGAQLPEYSGDLCANCQASKGAGAAGDVPCQRCGMYLPSHELQMWNARLYCAYCIMDVKDEEERMRKLGEKRKPSQEVSMEAAAGTGGEAQESGKGTGGICERCGKEASPLYALAGRRVCAMCYSEESGKDPPGTGPTMFAQIVSRAKQAMGMGNPRVIAARSLQGAGLVFDVEKRKMVERKGGEKPDGKKKS